MNDTWYDMGFDADMSWMYDWKGKEKKMTIDEAIDILEEVKELDDSIYQYNTKYLKALNVVIKALKQEPCDDAISRRAVLDLPKIKTRNTWGEVIYESVDIEDVKQLPPVDPQESIGHWIDADGDNAICSCCNRLNHLYGTYCKHCGAKMDKAQKVR